MSICNSLHRDRWAAPALLVMASLLLGGCASPMIQSDPAPAEKAVSGIVYALPKAQVLLKASRRLVQDEDVELAKKDADDKAAAAKAAEERQAEAAKQLKAREAEFKTAVAGDVGKAALEDFRLRRDLAQVLLTLAATRLDAAKKASSEAAAAYATVNGQVSRWVEGASLEVQASVPDPAHRFVARHDTSAWRDDALTLSVDKGLLSTGESKATGQAANVLVSLARAVAVRNIGTTAPGARSRFLSKLPLAAKTKPEAKPPVCEAYDFAWVFDPTNPAEVEAARKAIPSVSRVRLNFPGHEDGYAHNAQPVSRNVSLSGLAYRAPRTMLMEAVLNPGPLAKSAALTVTNGESQDPCPTPEGPAVARLAVSLPDSSATYVLAVEGAIWTKSAVKHVFKEGMLAEISIDRPSTLASVATLPVDIAKALVSVPAEIIKLRVDYSTQQTSETAQAVKLIEAQIDLLQAQRDLATAQAADKP